MNQMEIFRRQIGAFSNILLLFVWYVIGKRIGDVATTYVAVSVGVSFLFTTIVCGGVPDTLGRMLRSRRNKGQYKNVYKMKQSALVVQFLFGAVFALMLFFLARIVAENVLKIGYCTLLIRVLAVFIFFRSLSSLLTGYLQGEGFELPAAVAGIIRPFLILGFSRLFSGKMIEYGVKVGNLLQDENFAAMYSGVSVVLAICVAELFCMIFLMILYKGCSMLNKKGRQEGLKTTDSIKACISALLSGRFPLWIAEFMIVIAMLAGVFLWSRAEIADSIFEVAYSVYMHNYWVVYGIFIALVFILSIPVLSKTFEYIRKEDKRFARITFQSGVHISMAHGIFFAVFGAVMAGQIVGLMQPANEELVLALLRMGSGVVALGAVCCFYSRFLISAGRKIHVMGAVILTAVLFVAVNVIVFLLGKWTDKTFVITGTLALAALWIVLGSFAYRLMRVRVDWLQVIVMPLGAGCVAGLICMFLGKIFTPHLGNEMTLFVTFLLAMLIYWIVLLLMRNFKEQELDVIFGGKIIYALGQVLRVY